MYLTKLILIECRRTWKSFKILDNYYHVGI